MELIFSSVLAAIVLGAFFAAVRSHDANADLIYYKMNMEEQGMNALRKMEQELRMSAPSRITQSDGSAIVVGTNYSAIKFQVPDESSPTVASTYVVNWTGAHSITYSMSGTQLIRTDANATVETIPRTLCNFISSVAFSVPSSGIVDITLNLSQVLKNTRTITQTLYAKVQVKNT